MGFSSGSRYLGMFVIVAGGLVLAVGCGGDGPTSNGSAPAISQLMVAGALRAEDSAGVVNLTFQYSDADQDLNRAYLRFDDGQTATESLASERGRSFGTVGILQTVTLPEAGTEVGFSVYVEDLLLNRSNELTGSFVAP